ncbi:hypothetical protein DERP_009723 [Dermatophagoides pteronyssinus]|uniref:Uncharacterized protein n=1 Tax=Dermatophagoides pteronyssinus TaxID=6956 RepID=A0ABQ8IR86_DERPT|nr:hypothetical protein DERP_009723 [Dermatophagoides pteronyssinus]
MVRIRPEIKWPDLTHHRWPIHPHRNRHPHRRTIRMTYHHFYHHCPTSNTKPSASSATNMMVPYQALIQAALAAQSGSSAPSAAASASSPLSSSQQQSANALLSSLLSSSNQPSSSSWMTLPTSWSSMIMTNPSSLMSMLRPISSQTPIGGRRSSLTSRLRSIMNAIFYRNENNNNSPMMTSGSSYSYSYRPAPYGFAGSNSVGPGPSEMHEFSSIYGNGNNPTSYLYGTGPKSTNMMYGSASNYRPSFVAMPSSSSFMSAGANPWSSPIERPSAGPGSGSMPGMFGRNYGYGSATYHHHHPSHHHPHPNAHHHQAHNPHMASSHYPQQMDQVPYRPTHGHHQQPQHQQSQQYGPSMSESIPSIASTYTIGGSNSGANQWSSPLQQSNEQRPLHSGQVPVNNLDRPFVGPNNAIWSQGGSQQSNQNNNVPSQQPNGAYSSWMSNVHDDTDGRDGYNDGGSRDEGASYYQSNVFQSRISSPLKMVPSSSSSSSLSSSSLSSAAAAALPSPTYVGPKFGN